MPEPSIAQTVIFWVLALGVLGGALGTITRRNPVTAVMMLVGTFLALAGLYATLNVHFLAILQILVYAGAIMVLFIFVVMILNREEASPFPLNLGLAPRLLGVMSTAYILAKLYYAVSPRPGKGDSLDLLGLPAMKDDPGAAFGTVAAVGSTLFRDFLFPFEAISLLLLVAIVGGLVVSRSAREEASARARHEEREAVRSVGEDQLLNAAGAADPEHGGGH